MPNVICGIDKITNSSWLAFNKATGDFACVTNFRTPANQLTKKKYGSRGYLVIEYVKIRDPTIITKRFRTIEEYEENLLEVTTKGFNLVYGNIFDGTFKYYRNENKDVRVMLET